MVAIVERLATCPNPRPSEVAMLNSGWEVTEAGILSSSVLAQMKNVKMFYGLLE